MTNRSRTGCGFFHRLRRNFTMIVVLKHNPNPEQLQSLITWLQEKGIIIHTSIGEGNMLLGLVGDTSKIDADLISALDIVEDVKRVQEPYKNANRKFHPEDTVVKVGNTQIGGGNLTLMAGPCSVESEEQVVAIAKAVKASGATMLRGGAFKPRTSPYSFQGLGEVGLRYLEIAKEETGLPIVTELMDLSQLPLFKNVDVIQIGARNMQNFDLLKAVGRQEKPVMIKRGMSATYEEWLMSAEYVMAGGNENVILCERGVRTFETYTRNTLDLAAIPVLRKLTHLPIIVDPSHATGKSWLVDPLAMGAVATGCDGLLIEVHNDPAHALCDGPQSLKPEQFDALAKKLLRLKEFVKTIEE
jgi:3-deoxy-7-phosphoheptulonate synthase